MSTRRESGERRDSGIQEPDTEKDQDSSRDIHKDRVYPLVPCEPSSQNRRKEQRPRDYACEEPRDYAQPEGGYHTDSYSDPPRQLERVREADGEAKEVREPSSPHGAGSWFHLRPPERSVRNVEHEDPAHHEEEVPRLPFGYQGGQPEVRQHEEDRIGCGGAEEGQLARQPRLCHLIRRRGVDRSGRGGDRDTQNRPGKEGLPALEQRPCDQRLNYILSYAALESLKKLATALAHLRLCNGEDDHGT